MTRCGVCFRQCEIAEGGLGFCGARTCSGGEVKAANYGMLTALALDPIEKKPLHRFHSGSMILSVGSYGCNLRCPFCQNASISWSEEAMKLSSQLRYVSPEHLVIIAAAYREEGNIGIAFTYNEPLIGYEYVRDAAQLAHEAGMLNVMVTNGTASLPVLEELAPLIDAMNIDLKGFTDDYYRNVLRGDRSMVMDFIEHAATCSHVELTTLIVPGENDSEDEIRSMSRWIANLRDAAGRLIGPEIPLHISRFFPQFHMTDCAPTDVRTVYRLAEIAREHLKYVYTGNC